MILANGADVFVSTNKLEYKKFDALTELKELWQKCFVISMHTGFKQFDVTQILDVQYQEIETELTKINVANNLGTIFELMADPNQKLFTRNQGYIPISKLNCSDLIIDDEYRFCKLINKETMPKAKYSLFSINVAFNNNFLCNGLLVRGM